MDLLFLSLDVFSLVSLYRHLLSDSFVVHLVGKLSRLLALCLLPGIVLVKRLLTASSQLGIAETSQLQLAPQSYVVVFL